MAEPGRGDRRRLLVRPRARRAVPRRAQGRGATTATIHQGNVGNPGGLRARRSTRSSSSTAGSTSSSTTPASPPTSRSCKMSVEDWHKVLRVNLSGAFYMSKPALEHMLERGSGRIINISSIIGADRQHRPGQLRRVEVRPVRPDDDDGARRPRSSLERADKLDPDGARADRQRRGAGLHRDRDDSTAVPEKALDRIRAQVPLERLGPPRGGRARRALPRRRRLRPTSPARCGRSTAGWTCEQPARRHHPPPARAAGALHAPVRAHGRESPTRTCRRSSAGCASRPSRCSRASPTRCRRASTCSTSRRASPHDEDGAEPAVIAADPRRSRRCRPASAPRCSRSTRSFTGRPRGRGGDASSSARDTWRSIGGQCVRSAS